MDNLKEKRTKRIAKNKSIIEKRYNKAVNIMNGYFNSNDAKIDIKLVKTRLNLPKPAKERNKIKRFRKIHNRKLRHTFKNNVKEL